MVGSIRHGLLSVEEANAIETTDTVIWLFGRL
jgi:hypothetical protein